MKKQHDRVKADAMKEAREEQVCHLRKLRADAVQKAKDEDIEMVQKVAAEVEKEKKLAEDRKQANKEVMFKLLKESSEQVKVKTEKKLKAAREEIEEIKKYNEVLDAQDELRQKEVQKRREKQVELAEKMKEIVAQQKVSSGNEDQILANKQKEEADGRAIAALKHKEDRLREMRMENQAFLFQQMKEKEDRKKEEKDLKAMQAQILEAEQKTFLDIEKQRSANRHEKNVAHRTALVAQIHDPSS